MNVNFGDRVRIIQCAETIKAQVAGLEGDVHGFTTPSVTGVEVIGGAPDDYAVAVFLDGKDSALWFRPDLVEFIHFNAGVEIWVGNVKAVRLADGSWSESAVNSSHTTNKQYAQTQSGFLGRIKRLFKK